MLNIMVEAIIKRNLSVQIITGYRSWPNWYFRFLETRSHKF
jgi:hypothetical protein